MKKIALLFSSIIISVLLLTGCGGVVNNTREYFYKFGYDSTAEDGLLEHSSYAISAPEDRVFDTGSFAPSSYITGTGTYDVKLYSVGESKTSFKMVTDFNFKGRYFDVSTKTYSEYFEDTITGVSEMTISSTSYQPVSSKKTFMVTYLSGQELTKAHYEINASYTQGEKGIALKSSVTDLPIEGLDDSKIMKFRSDKNSDYKISFDDRYFDNEHILLGLRIQNISSTFSDTFYVANSVTAMDKPDKINFVAETVDAAKVEKRTLNEIEYECTKLIGTLQNKFKGQEIVALFSNNYTLTYKKDKLVVKDNQNISLLMEFTQEDLTYKLVEYNNYSDQLLK